MWVVVLLAVIIIGFFVIRKVMDRETLARFSFLIKVLAGVFGVTLLLGLSIIIKNG